MDQKKKINKVNEHDTKQIQKFIKNISKKQRQNTFSNESRIFIEKIFHYMEKCEVSSQKEEYTFSRENLRHLPKGKYYDLLEPSIKTEIENRMQIFKKTTFQIGIRQFHIYMSFDNNGYYSETDVKQWLKYIYNWFYIASKFAISAACSKQLSVYIYYTHLKKTFPEIDREPIDSGNANTAFTFACASPNNKAGENEMYIYRIEEWFKVLIHESIHSFGLDFASMEQNSVHKRICTDGEIYHIPTCIDLRFYESYTEMWAEFLHSMFAAFYQEKDSKSIEENIAKLEEYIFGYEATFSAFQSTKVLGHFGLTYNDLFDRNKTMQYKEKTPVFSYYVIKSVFMNHVDEFILWNMQHNNGSIQFKKTQTNIHRLADLLKSLSRNATYLRKMANIHNMLLTKPIEPLLENTMRMSCISFIA